MTPERFRQIEELYHSVQDKPAGARLQLLEQADSELRQEVESLLEQRLRKSPLDERALDLAAGLAEDSGVMEVRDGQQLGPYQIEARIGSGGMGQVYRARDTRLGRFVALKFSNREFDTRFEREARAISALNHPNICVLYDIGPNYLVMELLDGPTVAKKLSRGPLGIDLTLHYGAQIANALAAAHAQGIVHRDLKPGNIVITKSSVKVLDFGLAKSPQDEALTGAHFVLGSPAYMAPEQREGKECDARTDIYALGIVLYEMATGRRPHPEGALFAENLPEGLTHVIQRCLKADREQRWQSARDLGAELEWLARPEKSVPASRKQWVWVSLAALLVSLIVGLVFLTYFTRKAPNAALVQFSFSPTFKADAWDVAISPDGTRIAFADSNIQQGEPALWLRSLDSPEGRQLAGTEGAIRPFWSPDGHSLGFVTPSGIKRIDFNAEQSSVHNVTPSGGYFLGGGAWNQQGMILFQPEQTGGGLFSVPAGGGTPVAVTRLNSAHKEITHRYPQFLPDGRHFLYWVWSAADEYTGVYIGSLDQEQKLADGPLIRTWREAHYAEPGYLLYVEGSNLIARRFDSARLQFTADATPLPERVGLQWNWTGQAMFSNSATGILVYQEAVPQPGSRMLMVDRAGHVTRSLAAPPGSGGAPSLDPAHKNIVFSGEDTNTVEILWRMDLTSGALLRITTEQGSNSEPIWSPDGRQIAFRANRSGVFNLYVKNADNSGDEQLVLKSPNTKYPTGWSQDGRFLTYDEADPLNKFRRNLWALSLKGDGKAVPFFKSRFDQRQGTLSPVTDHRGRYWIAFTSNETGLAEEVYLRPFVPESPNRSGLEVRVSARGGAYPFWRSDGRELFYFEGNQLMTADVNLGGGDAPDVQAPRKLFAVHDPPCTVLDLGQHFLCFEDVADYSPKIKVALNWTNWLKKD